MRTLNYEEENLCKLILNGHNKRLEYDTNLNCIENILGRILDEVKIIGNRSTKSVEIEFNAGIHDLDIVPVIKDVSLKIITITNLIKLLEKNGYIYIVQSSNNLNNIFTISGTGYFSPSIPITHTLPDKDISKLLVKYATKDLIVTESFKQFYEDNFVPIEIQRLEKQQFSINLSIFAIIISLASLLIALYKI